MKTNIDPKNKQTKSEISNDRPLNNPGLKETKTAEDQPAENNTGESLPQTGEEIVNEQQQEQIVNGENNEEFVDG